MPLSTAASLSTSSSVTPELYSALAEPCRDAVISRDRDWRLHKHADYQRVYKASRKQFSTLMAYFAAPQTADRAGAEARVGITAGKVLGKAVERNRIKRRMRAAIVGNLDVLCAEVDVVLHPKRSVLTAEWPALKSEVRRVFLKIREMRAQETKAQETKVSENSARPVPERNA